MYRDIRLNEIIKPQLNIDKIKTQVKPSFIDCLQHSIAKVKGESDENRVSLCIPVNKKDSI